jgi:peptide/nickel transport system ATP-binding protein
MIDASLRVTVLEVMVGLKKELGISQMYITHDLSTALQISDNIIVMYKGHIVESGKAERVIIHPKHPYTQLLINCIPIASPKEKWTEKLDAEEYRDISKHPNACCFADRCPYMNKECLKRKPDAVEVEESHYAACYRCTGGV